MFYWRIYPVGLLTMFLSAWLLAFMLWIPLGEEAWLEPLLTMLALGTMVVVVFGALYGFVLTAIWNLVVNRLVRSMPLHAAAVRTSAGMAAIMSGMAQIWLWNQPGFDAGSMLAALLWCVATTAIAAGLTGRFFRPTKDGMPA